MMKSNTFAVIDAHVIRCRLHHKNSLSYSVGLKSGKEQSVNTNFKQANELIIEMDTHLTLHADKHSYQHFPKLTLVVNVVGENKEKKSIGTTFANYRKEGIQTYQISQCSCKDKAFEVDICFSTKIIEAKNSNSKSNKKQIKPHNKATVYSTPITPRESRQFRAQTMLKIPRQAEKVEDKKKEGKLVHVKSQKIVPKGKQTQKISVGDGMNLQYLKKQIAVLNQKLVSYELKFKEVQSFRQQLKNQRLNHQKWFELYKLEQQKNGQAMSHIVSLEEIILILMQKPTSSKRDAVNNSFRVIEEEDQIISINQELQNELEKQRKKNGKLNEEIQKLKIQVKDITFKLSQSQEKFKKMQYESSLKIKTPVQSIIEPTNQILITSRCQYKQTEKCSKCLEMKKEINSLEEKSEKLLIQLQRLKNLKKNYEQESSKNVTNLKKKDQTIPKKLQNRQPMVQKGEKIQSKEKPLKQPPKSPKKNNVSSQSTADNKKRKQDNKSNNSTMGLNTKIDPQLQTKTEGTKSTGKQSDIKINEIKSETPTKVINEAQYLLKTFEGEFKQYQK